VERKISSEFLKSLYDTFKNESPELNDLRFLVLRYLGFAGFFRIEELLAVQLTNLTIKKTHIEINIEKSKCDQHWDGHVVIVSIIDSNYTVQSNYSKNF